MPRLPQLCVRISKRQFAFVLIILDWQISESDRQNVQVQIMLHYASASSRYASASSRSSSAKTLKPAFLRYSTARP